MSERPDLVDPLPEDEPLPGENIPDRQWETILSTRIPRMRLKILVDSVLCY